MTTRRTISRSLRVRVFLAHEGKCHLCKLKIDAVKHSWHVEHVVPLWRNGKDDESNMRPAHVDCHASKSADEAPQRAKSDRIRATRLGVKRTPRGRPLPGTKASGIRKRMSGAVERW